VRWSEVSPSSNSKSKPSYRGSPRNSPRFGVSENLLVKLERYTYQGGLHESRRERMAFFRFGESEFCREESLVSAWFCHQVAAGWRDFATVLSGIEPSVIRGRLQGNPFPGGFRLAKKRGFSEGVVWKGIIRCGVIIIIKWVTSTPAFDSTKTFQGARVEKGIFERSGCLWNAKIWELCQGIRAESGPL